MELILKEISGHLPTSDFELKEGNKVIGKLQLRHRPSKSADVPEGFENHIYYEIEPNYRGKGYGKRILALGLEEARKLGLSEVIVTCDSDNISSRKIIEANGGELLDEQPESNGKMVRKYKITVA